MEQKDQPVASGDYKVRQGDCLASIASHHGFLWKTIWLDPGNEKLRSARKNPNALLPGDRLTIPEKVSKSESCAAKDTHRFRVIGGSAKLRLRLLKFGEPRENIEFSLDVDGEVVQDSTDSDGFLEVPIRNDGSTATLTVHADEGDEVYPITLGSVNPSDTLSGTQQRLFNLGYDCGPADGILGPRTRSALASFQAARELEVTDYLNDDTIQELEKAHGG